MKTTTTTSFSRDHLRQPPSAPSPLSAAATTDGMDSKNSSLEVPYRECWHRMRAHVARSNTSKNPGRLFWGCPLWMAEDCKYFEWLPRDAAAAYMKLHGLDGVEVIDKGDSLDTLGRQHDNDTKLVDENRALRMRQAAIVDENRTLRMRQESMEDEIRTFRMRQEVMVNQGQKTTFFCLVFGLLLGFILGRM